jgi:hypothetical protein
MVTVLPGKAAVYAMGDISAPIDVAPVTITITTTMNRNKKKIYPRLYSQIWICERYVEIHGYESWV